MAGFVVVRVVRVLFGALLLAGVIVMVTRLGEEARFVTWPAVGFTALAAATAALGAAAVRGRTGPFVAGLLASLPVAYVVPAAPLVAVALVVLVLAALARALGGPAAGLATGVGTALVLLTVLQGPVVSCGASSVSTNSGPWWVGSSGSSTGSGVASLDGGAVGTLQVGDRHYDYACDGGRLTTFRRSD